MATVSLSCWRSPARIGDIDDDLSIELCPEPSRGVEVGGVGAGERSKLALPGAQVRGTMLTHPPRQRGGATHSTERCVSDDTPDFLGDIRPARLARDEIRVIAPGSIRRVGCDGEERGHHFGVRRLLGAPSDDLSARDLAEACHAATVTELQLAADGSGAARLYAGTGLKP